MEDMDKYESYFQARERYERRMWSRIRRPYYVALGVTVFLVLIIAAIAVLDALSLAAI